MIKNTWLTEKPDFDEECTFITASRYVRNDEPLEYDYEVWQIRKIDGYGEDDKPGWYFGLLNGDGEEWGDLSDLDAAMYYIVDNPPAKQLPESKK